MTEAEEVGREIDAEILEELINHARDARSALAEMLLWRIRDERNTEGGQPKYDVAGSPLAMQFVQAQELHDALVKALRQERGFAQPLAGPRRSA